MTENTNACSPQNFQDVIEQLRAMEIQAANGIQAQDLKEMEERIKARIDESEQRLSAQMEQSVQRILNMLRAVDQRTLARLLNSQAKSPDDEIMWPMVFPE